MEYSSLKDFRRTIPSFAVFCVVMLVLRVDGQQVNTACSSSMVQSFTPCLGFLTNGGSSSPTRTCCQSLRYLMSNGTDCLCLIVTGNVPFSVPINRTLAISLPKACRNSGVPGVPVECKASVAPLPAPGPAAFRPTASPTPSGSIFPMPFAPPPSFSPPTDDNVPTGLTPPTPTTDNSGLPNSNPTGFRPDLTPDHATPSQHLSFVLLLAALGTCLLKLY